MIIEDSHLNDAWLTIKDDGRALIAKGYSTLSH